MDKRLHLFHELSEHISLRLNSFREDVHDSLWIENKAHHDYDLWFIQSGRIILTIGHSQFIAEPGDVVFFYPDITYTATTEVEGCSFIYVHFDFALEHQLRILDDFKLAGVIPEKLIRGEYAMFREACLRDQARAGQSGTRLYLKGCLTIAMAKIIELCSSGAYTGTFESKRGEGRGQTSACLAILQPVFRHIHDNLERPVRICELAAVAGMSEKYFITYFRKALGVTPGQYVYQIKMNRARDYIYQRKYSVQQIAGLLGYPDPFSFSKAFKKYYKIPPSRFV